MDDDQRQIWARRAIDFGTAGLVLTATVGLIGMWVGARHKEKLDALESSMEAWKAETQANLYQAIADMQARGVVDFRQSSQVKRLRSVKSRKVGGTRQGGIDADGRER